MSPKVSLGFQDFPISLETLESSSLAQHGQESLSGSKQKKPVIAF